MVNVERLNFGAADSAIPKIRWRKSKVKHWFSHDTVHLIKMKHRLHNCMIKSPEGIKSRYKRISNLVRFKPRKDTELHVSSLSNKYFDSPKPFWRGSTLSKVRNRSRTPPLLQNNDTLTADTQKAETFNVYFSSVFTADDGSDVLMLRGSLTFHSSALYSIKFTPENVYEELINLQCDKACGPELLPSRLLRFGLAVSTISFNWKVTFGLD